MKKRILILIFCLCLSLCLFGCAKNTEEEENLTGAYSSDTSSEALVIDEDDKNIFDKAIKNYETTKLSVYALLATQKSEGTNYLFLAKSSKKENTNWALVIANKSTKNKVTLTSVKEFNFTDYTGEDITVNEDDEDNWKVNSKLKGSLDEDLIEFFDSKNKTLTSCTFTPITLLGTQVVAGTNYAILSRVNNLESKNKTYDLAVITVYKDLNGVYELTSVGEIDLAKLTK